MAKVLVIDDNSDTAETLAMLLGIHGHDARAVTSGLAAFHHVPEFTPDVCLIESGCRAWTGTRWPPGSGRCSGTGRGCWPSRGNWRRPKTPGRPSSSG